MNIQISDFLNPTGNFYLYGYPIISSIFSGFIFWLIFSYLPERKRKQSFGLGVLNDLRTLNMHIFHYFDYLLRHRDNSPSYFQDKIQACSLTYDELTVGLKNKVISSDYLYDSAVADNFLLVGEELVRKVSEIDIVINRLYSFNYFLSPNEVTLIRSIYANLHKYMPYIESSFTRGKYYPADPTVSFLAHSAKDLQEDFKKLRGIIFANKLKDKDFLVAKILQLFHSENYTACIKECKKGIKIFKAESPFYEMLLIRCYVCSDKSQKAYELLNHFNFKDSDLVSYRHMINPLLSDPHIESIILNKTSLEALTKMKSVTQREYEDKENFLKQNNLLKERYSIESHLGKK
ncbi:hypothetical protein [Methylophilus sp. Q8]|uniref:hypothetical protein n=1 Tax=Methylophilus sp. Q8 TaxID=1506586 RepID=UPI0006473DE6|nr:hypothetical protein [Methylophilus sp. Q8]